MDIVFLGTASMTPTKERAQSTLLIKYSGKHLLFDCGEGTQRQMRIAGIPVPKTDAIFISHWHGDHVMGLHGMFENIGKWGFEKKVTLYGPRGSKRKVENILDCFGLQKKITVNVIEIVKDGVFYEGKDFVLEARQVSHTIPCIGYAFIEKDRRRMKMRKIKKLGIPEGPILGKLQKGKDVVFEGKKVKSKDVTDVVEGKKITYVTDSAYCKPAIALAKNADVFICEATFSSEQQDLAKEYMHMTPCEAAKIAKQAKAKQLILTHFSQRNNDAKVLEKEAKKVFKNVICASDFLKISL